MGRWAQYRKRGRSTPPGAAGLFAPADSEWFVTNLAEDNYDVGISSPSTAPATFFWLASGDTVPEEAVIAGPYSVNAVNNQPVTPGTLNAWCAWGDADGPISPWSAPKGILPS